MTTFDFELPATDFKSPPARRPGGGLGGRLIVLLPGSESDAAKLAQRIWKAAGSIQVNVLLLSLFSQPHAESRLRRQMITMAAMIQDSNISAEIHVAPGNDWVKQVKRVCRPGDIVACYSEHRVGLLHRGLDQILRSRLELPVYVFAGAEGIRPSRPGVLLPFSSWAGSLAIIGGFFLVQLKLVQLPHDWGHIVLFYACMFLEIPVMLMWSLHFT